MGSCDTERKIYLTMQCLELKISYFIIYQDLTNYSAESGHSLASWQYVVFGFPQTQQFMSNFYPGQLQVWRVITGQLDQKENVKLLSW